MILAIALALVAADVDPIAALERAAESRPDDVDVRLRLAHVLSWKGQRAAARNQALRVVELAPRYWDAHVLLARIDVWEKNFEAARVRLDHVLTHEPLHADAGLLSIDVDLRTGALDDAEHTLFEHMKHWRSPELLHRLSALELARGNHVAARAAANEALQRDPENVLAERIVADVPLVVADFWTEVSFLPYGEFGWQETIVVRALPRHYFSLTIVDELRRRFGATDNTLRLQADWRVTRDVTLTALGGFGAPARIVPKWTVSGVVSVNVSNSIDASLTYRHDDLPINANLHRGRFDVGYAWFGPFRAEATYSFGLLDYDVDLAPVHFARLDAVCAVRRGELRAGYSYGTSVDLLLDPSNPAFDDPEKFLRRLSSHTLGASGSLRISRHFAVLIGFDVQMRSDRQQTYGLRSRLSVSY